MDMKQGDATKLGAALVILAIAAILIGWSLGLFGGGSAPPSPTPAVRERPPGPQLAPGAQP